MDYRSALAALLQNPSMLQQSPVDPLQQLLSPPSNGLSPLPEMFEKQYQQQNPRVMSREINPGMTWGGKDRNAIMPDDVMRSYFSVRPGENI